ncbi:MAG: hypothetical protein H0T85_07535 [Geodermatophilaceae bacterium]|nr:hypothetical protein [Geodermatophilaceae bacterium]
MAETTRARTARLAAASGVSIGELVDWALDAYETRVFWEQAQAALARLPVDPEDVLGDRTAADGLDRG